MAYIRTNAPLSGLTSRVQGRSYAPRGLSGLTSDVQGKKYAPRGLGGLFSFFDTPSLPPMPAPTTEEEWRLQMLAYQRAVADKATGWVEQDKMLRYLQLAATLAIPLTAAFWRWFLGRRRGSDAASAISA